MTASLSHSLRFVPMPPTPLARIVQQYQRLRGGRHCATVRGLPRPGPSGETTGAVATR